MPHPTLARPPRPRRLTDPRGFTIVEMLLVSVLAVVLLGITIVQTKSGTLTFRANGARDQLKAKLHVAREIAVSRQRLVSLTFTSDGKLVFKQINSATDQPQIDVVEFENTMQFMTASDQPLVDDEYHLCTEATGVLNSREGLRFTTEGALVDQTFEPVSGCFYIGAPNLPQMWRAVRVFGPTGALKTYDFQNTHWTH